ncbi:MAG: xanthine dehydrogenase family protein subunit M [Acidimicrobiia bacterium]|nr:MAG: xanthine dehydrogenase family protein subunit M [Acidimicrobiia bacterium]
MHFVDARDLAVALDAKAEQPEAEFLAGGTDLMVEVNLSHHRPEGVIAVRRCEELLEQDSRRIGAAVTWARLERSPHRALAQLARTIGSPQIRAAGTMGGNVATASPAGDGLPWIAAVDAEIEVVSRDRGRRIIPWSDFFVGVKDTTLALDEIITAVVLPEQMPVSQEFAKVGQRNAMVIATVNCVVVRGDDGFRVALGSVAPVPIRAGRAEQMINAETSISEAVLEEFARLVAEEVRPISDHRSTEAYRRHASGVLASRLVQRCLSA